MIDIKGLTFVNAVELADGRLMVGSQDPSLNVRTQPHTGVLFHTAAQGWEEIGMLHKVTVDMATNERGDAALFLDPFGHVTEIGQGPIRKTQLLDRDGKFPEYEMRTIQSIGGATFAAGMGRQTYRRDAGGPWQMVSTPQMAEHDPPKGFEGIAGFDANEVYFAGWRGEIWKLTEATWGQLESPTNIILNDIAAGPETCLAAGVAGLLVTGRRDAWSIVDHDFANETFWSVRYFSGAFYLASINGIYRFDGADLLYLKPLDDDLRTAYSLSVGPSGLWSVGPSDICLFDGDTWTTIAQS